MFKSYYVVWKLYLWVDSLVYFFGLNRTMQYGNSKKIKRSGGVKSGLNRTMQYGNLSAVGYIDYVEKV